MNKNKLLNWKYLSLIKTLLLVQFVCFCICSQLGKIFIHLWISSVLDSWTFPICVWMAKSDYTHQKYHCTDGLLFNKLLHYILITTYILSLAKSNLVKLETSQYSHSSPFSLAKWSMSLCIDVDDSLLDTSITSTLFSWLTN